MGHLALYDCMDIDSGRSVRAPPMPDECQIRPLPVGTIRQIFTTRWNTRQLVHGAPEVS